MTGCRKMEAASSHELQSWAMDRLTSLARVCVNRFARGSEMEIRDVLTDWRVLEPRVVEFPVAVDDLDAQLHRLLAAEAFAVILIAWLGWRRRLAGRSSGQGGRL